VMRTNVAEFASSPLSIDLSRIGAICEEEWQSFLDDIDIDPIPERQDLRAFFLNWVAVFVPEAFPSSLTGQMAAWMGEHESTDETVWGFAKPPLIGATLFALTDSPYWLRVQTSNFDYGGSQLRNFLHKTLALIAPRMTFDSDLVARLDHGLKVPFFMMDTPLVVYAVTKGDAAEKIANLKKWRDAYSMNTAEAETVDRLLKGDPAENPLQSWLLRNTSYATMRIGCYPAVACADTTLPLGAALSDIWSRVDEHPLFSAYVKLDRPAEKEFN
jgi:hypothetical protein